MPIIALFVVGSVIGLIMMAVEFVQAVAEGIFDLGEDQVFGVIRDAGQTPHPAYAIGMSRLSCICIMASRADLRTAARLQPKSRSWCRG